MKKKLFILFFTFLIIVIQLVSPSFCDDTNEEETISVNSELISTLTNSTNTKNIPEINSRACVVIDRATNTILYGKNEKTVRKMASTTKIMTATIIIENCNLDETIEVSKKAAGTGGSRLGLKTGDKITIRDLLYGLMLCSGNDAAVALAEYAGGDINGFCKLMNEKAVQLGLSNTHFETPHGLDADSHYTTAYELAILSNYALNNKTFSKIVGTKNYTVIINGYPKDLSNTNELLGNLYGVYGIKTGFTNGANRCLVSACKRNDLDIICVVLGADTKNFRTSDSIKLINYVFDNFRVVNLKSLIKDEFEKWKSMNNTFNINKGESQNLEITLEIDESFCNFPIKNDLINSLNFSFNCQTDFEAPVFENIQIGNVQVSAQDNIFADCKIYTSSEIDKKSVNSYLVYFIKNFTDIIYKTLYINNL